MPIEKISRHFIVEKNFIADFPSFKISAKIRIMATNYIKPFAISSTANVLSDAGLAERQELQTGFILKSKADSKLIGKLIQNATAGAYAVGQFTATHQSQNVTGNDPTTFASAFQSALQAFIQQNAPAPDLSGYAPLNSPALTGNPTVNGNAIATENEIPDLSGYATKTELQSEVSSLTQEIGTKANDDEVVKLEGAQTIAGTKTFSSTISGSINGNAATASQLATARTISLTGDASGSASFNGATDASIEVAVSHATSADSATKATQDGSGNTITSTYATVASVNAKAPLASPAFTGTVTVNGQTVATTDLIPSLSGYLTEANASNTYLSKTDASNTYQVKGNYATVDQIPSLSGYLTETNAASTYLSKTDASSLYLGKTEKAASATVADSANSVAGANVSGAVANATNADNATKATQDSDGNQINTTYLKTSAITYGTSDLTAGSSPLATGSLYFVYE